MALVFPTPAQAAAQTPVNTFSPSSTPLTNTDNNNTYTYIPAKAVWVIGSSSSGVASIAVVSPIQSSGGPNPTLSITASGIGVVGAVALSDATNSPATNVAATANAVCKAVTCAANAIPCACLLAKGNILAASAANTPTALPVGADGLVLTACAAAPTGLCWAAAGGGGGGTVTSITAGTGLTGGTITTSGTINLANTAVVSGAYTYASVTVDAQGRLTSASSGTAPVTSIATGTGLTGGPITSTGTVSLANTAVTPGSYTYGSFTVDAQGRLTAASSGTAPVTAVTGTAPIVSSGGTTPAISLANTAVTPGSYTYSSFTVDAQGRLTAASSGTAPVTTVTGTAPIVSSGGATPSISLADTAVTPGSYTYSSFTVDAQGRLTAASSGTAPNTTVTSPITNTGTSVAPIIGIQDATTTQKGAVQVGTNVNVAAGVISVNDATYTLPGDPTSTKGLSILNATTSQTVKGQALDATIGKTLQDQINSLLTTSNLTLVGTFDATASTVGDLTAAGTAAGFTAGADLLAPAPALLDYYVIVTTPGSYSPPGGGGPYNANQGDWFLCDGAQWIYLNVGYDAPVASTTSAGIVELATNAETQTGTDSTRAVTPAGAASTYIPLACLTGKGAILGASAAGTPAALPVGADGRVLFACSTAANGLCWEVIPEATPIASGKVLGYTGAAVNCNVSLGYCALGAAGTLGIRNVAIGYEALRSADPAGLANCLTAVGYQALRNTTSGFWLTAVGACALCSNTTGCGNTAIGARTLFNSTSASRNTAVGAEASLLNSSGSENTSVGFNASYYTTTGASNTSVGSNALLRNTSGSSNTAVGNCALQGKETGSGNTAVGHKAMAGGGCVNPVIALNTALGCEALFLNDFGCNNIAVGVGSLGRLICGSCNIAIGCQAGFTYVSECGNVILGRWNGTSLDCNTLALADGNGNLKLKFNCDGALSFDALNYGTAGQVLQSNGPGAKPTWGAGGGGGGGTVTSITAGTGLTGGTITSSGTVALGIATNAALGGVIPDGTNITVNGSGNINLGTTAVTPGSYTYASVTVDCHGRLTAASNGIAPVTAVTGTAPISVTAGTTPVVSITAASTVACGAVELATDAETITGTSQTLAVTPFGARCTYTPKNIVFKGALITACLPGTPIGLAPGSDNQVLVANSFANAGLEWQSKIATPTSDGFILGCTTATNTALGCNTLLNVTTGLCNTVLGGGSGSLITSGCNNIAIGAGVQVASATGNCQLAIGFASGQNWLTGDSTKAIRPGAGIIDCANSCGTAGQVLMSNGANAICWGAAGGPAATPSVRGSVLGCTEIGGTFSAAVGYQALLSLTSGAGNAAVGYQALRAVTTGGGNAAVGRNALFSLTDGIGNFAGNNGLYSLTTGNQNVAIGNNSFNCLQTNSSNNVAVGANAGYLVCFGGGNSYIGFNAGQNVTTGSDNVAIGCNALASSINNIACFNVALGSYSLFGVTNGCGNTAVGLCAGRNITTGSRNVVIGCDAQVASGTGSCQLAIGYSPTANWLTGNSTGAIKPGAGIIDCANSCGTAGQVLMSNGLNAVCWGSAGGVGSQATPIVLGTVYGKQCSSAVGLTSYGYCSGGTTTGTCNTAVGWCSLMGTSGNANIAIGACSQAFATSDNNISVGNSALQGASGNCNIAIGNGSMSSLAAGSVNTAVGTVSLNSLTRGFANAAFGWNALRNAGTGAGLSNIDENTAFGTSALCAVTTGCRNTAVGAYAGCAITTGCTNVVIGPCVQVASATGSCQLAIGYSATANWLTGNGSKAIQPGAGIIDCAVSCGTANMVLTSQGNAVQWKSVASTIAVPNYGSFLSTVSQSNLDTTNGNKVTYNTTTESRNVSVVDSSKLTVAVAGTYNIQMSMQVTKTDAGTDDMTFWFKKNGVNIDNSATNLTLEGNNNAQLASLNFVITLAAGDYIEIWWYSIDTNVVLLAEPAAAPAPAIPSIIATVVPVGA